MRPSAWSGLRRFGLVRLDVISSGDRPGQRRLPPWLKRPLPGGADFVVTRRIVAESGVATVCEDAKCPNLAECWSRRTATFMILGHRCTRRCHFCSVETARPATPEPDEPERVARAVAELGLRHAVITAVARDDLPDEGAGQFARCIRAIKDQEPGVVVEVLPADLHARLELIETICAAGPDIYNHNLEMVERLTPKYRPQGRYRRSLDVLRMVKNVVPELITKSGLMLGLGETRAELVQAFDDLRAVGCDVLTLGQYLSPGPGTAPVAKYYPPEEFADLGNLARARGFLSVASAPFVRSSYNASEVFEQLVGRRPLRGSSEPRTASPSPSVGC
ncbi:MAG: lipoyl synthase [bacterium]|nr:lipoyl synthase [bacterium]